MRKWTLLTVKLLPCCLLRLTVPPNEPDWLTSVHPDGQSIRVSSRGAITQRSSLNRPGPGWAVSWARTQ